MPEHEVTLSQHAKLPDDAQAVAPDDAPAQAPQVSSALVRGLLQFCQVTGLPTAPAQAALGHHAQVLDDPDHAVPATRYAAAFEACCQAHGRPDWGARLGAASRLSQLGVLGFLLLSCGTLGEALQAYARYQRALGETLQLQLLQRDGQVLLALQPMHPSAAHPQRLEALVAALDATAHELCGRRLPWQGLCLPHPASAALRALLGGVPQASQPGPAQLSLPSQVLAWPVQHAGSGASLTAALQAHLAARLTRRSDQDWPAQVAAVVSRQLAGRQRPSLVGVAAELQLSPRALQLRLQAQGTGFRAVLEAVMQTTARDFLAAGARASEVAYLLGFAEEAAFFRAFKRWTGQTPSQWRSPAGPSSPPKPVG